MRPLLLVGILAALAGCSMPYEGTSFKAVPKFEASKEGGEGHEAEAASENTGAGTMGSPVVKTGTAFPTTVQPSGKPAAESTTVKEAEEKGE